MNLAQKEGDSCKLPPSNETQRGYFNRPPRVSKAEIADHPRSTIKHLKRIGWTVRKNAGHYKCISLDGARVIMGSTPSDYRARLNVLSRIRGVL